MIRLGGLFISLLCLLGLGCGETSRDDAPGGASGGKPEGAGGASGSSGGGAETDRGGAGGRRAGLTGGTGASEGGMAGRDNGGAGSGGDSTLGGVDLSGTPIYTRVQRLTNRQWENAVNDILRFSQRQALAARFVPNESGTATFDNNERVLFVDPPRFGDFEVGAEAAATLATSSAEALAALDAGNDAATFIRVLGRRAFRRPLTAEEEAKYQTLFSFGERLYGAGFANGAALVLRGLLESPHFLYRTELGPAGGPLTPYELASKLSFWLLGTTPSDSLLDSAAAGELADLAGLEAAARQMLEDPRAVAVMRDFHEQLLNTRAFDTLSKATPEFDASIDPELALASSAFFDLVFQKNLGVRELLTSKQAYVGPALAPFYGLDAPASGLELRDLGPSRSGYFMQVPFLMLGAEETQPDTIRRGTALMRAMLCEGIGVPASIFPPLPEAKPGETNRQRVTQHTAACGFACHARIDPLGFALENFDGLGRARETDNGQPIDTSGSYPFAEGVRDYTDGNELMKIMAESAQVHTCYSKNVSGYALGRDIVEDDRPLLEGLAKVSLSQSLKEMAVALVRDPAFRMRKEGQP